jgi:hypothetical protein
MSSKSADQFVSNLSKKKVNQELDRLQSLQDTKPKVYEGEGTGTRTPPPIPSEQMASTERARSNSRGGRRRHHKKTRRHRR